LATAPVAPDRAQARAQATAAKVYERQGYRPFGTLPDFPAGRSRIFLQKRLA